MFEHDVRNGGPALGGTELVPPYTFPHSAPKPGRAIFCTYA